MSNVKRYDPEGYGQPASVSGTGTHMIERRGGDYVLASDFDALRADLDQLRRWEKEVRENSPLLIRLEAAEAERDSLRAKLNSRPTTEAYEAACAALCKHRGDAKALRAEVERLRPDAERYRYVRRLDPNKFGTLWRAAQRIRKGQCSGLRAAHCWNDAIRRDVEQRQ